jgi:hypothetical protein
MHALRRSIAAALAIGLALTTSGCIMRFFTGHGLNDIVAADFVSKADGLEDIRVAFDAETTINLCSTISSPYGPSAKHFARCTFVIEGSTIQSSADFEPGELGFLAGIIDPLLVQLPANATDLHATFTRDGVTSDLAITQFPGSVPVDGWRTIVPEPGRRLIAVDFPTANPAVGGSPYQFHMDFHTSVPTGSPVTVKGMFTARVTVRRQDFYQPLRPCVTDLTLIPPITIPRAAGPQSISLTGQASPRGCGSGTQYVIAPKAVPTVDVVEYYHAGLEHYFITWTPVEIAILDAGIQSRGSVRTGKLFNGYSSAQAGTAALCRYYLPPQFGDSHFFGRGAAECAGTGAQHPESSSSRTRATSRCSCRSTASARRAVRRSIACSAIARTPITATRPSARCATAWSRPAGSPRATALTSW